MASRGKALVLVGVLALAYAPADAVVPGPVTVEAGAPDGALSIAPAARVVRLEAGNAANHSITITNGGEVSATFDLDVVDAAAAPDGSLSTADGRSVRSARSWVQLPAPSIRLRGGERASVPVAVTVPRDTPSQGVVAVVTATAVDLDPVTSVRSTILVQVGEVAAPTADLDFDGDDRLVLTLSADGGAVVDPGRLTVRPWLGPPSLDARVDLLVVLPRIPRVVTVERATGPVPGPYRADAALQVSGGDLIHVTATRWAWQRGLTLVVAIVALLAATVLLLAARRRQRPTYPAPAEKEPMP